MDESWKDVSDFPGYEVSNHGRVRRSPNAEPASGSTPGAILKPGSNAKNYQIVTLRRDGKTVSQYVHDLVGRHFLKGYKPGITIQHKNRDRTNNRLENLEIMSRADNSGHGRLSLTTIAAIRKFRKDGVKPGRAAFLLGIRVGVVQAVYREIDNQ